MNEPKAHLRNVKRLFWKLGTCSQTQYHILNREFAHPEIPEERASDPLAGGFLGCGHQCGLLWGASLAVGAEAYRRFGKRGKAVGLAIAATQHLLTSFTARTGSADCRAVTGCNWKNPLSIARHLLTGRVAMCFRLAEQWAPEAVVAATEGLAREQTEDSFPSMSCASEAARRMGAGEQDAATVAGLAGGLGLSGGGCGALGAAMWISTLTWCRQHPNKSGYSNPGSKRLLKAFRAATGSEFLCSTIVGRRFRTTDEHTEFVKCGGCDKLMSTLAAAS